ncbi:MAG: sugar kinase [Clostridiales bacterium]|nr:sugar kinase [Clostridiales bacterium]
MLNMKLRENYKYAIVVPTSMGVRITPVNRQPVYCSDTFIMQATSAETNVASIASYLGMPVKVLTTFVKDSPIAEFIKANLRARGMEYEGKEVEQGGPWGYRHQFNIADSGFGGRGPRVLNDRAGEVGRILSAKDFDLEKLFGTDGVGILHMSGLIAALSPGTGEFCLELAGVAKKYGTLVSFDLNYRASFWQGRKTDLCEIFTKIASMTDILIGGKEHFELCLGIKVPDTISGRIHDNIEAIKKVRERYPDTKVIAATLREEKSANLHNWGAVLLSGEDWQVIEPREIEVLDRIGGGDGFVGGLLYAILKGWDAEKQAQFAWAAGALAVTFLTDYAQPADEEQVWSVWEENARVKR